MANLGKRLGRSYWVWRLYHALIADAVTFQKPTKFSIVHEYLGRDLGLVADVGCGPGVFTRYLCRRSRHVIAADIDEKSLSRTFARNTRERNLTASVISVDQLPFLDGSVDTILFLEVLEHIDDDAGALRELHRILSDTGRMVISVPVPPGDVNKGEAWGHKREGYEFSEMETLLGKTGFEVARHGFAQFKFSRLAEKWNRSWRTRLRLPAPFFLGWICYLDFLLDAQRRGKGDFQPQSLIVLVKKSVK